MNLTYTKEDVICADCKKLIVANSFAVSFDDEIICRECAFSIATNTIEELQKFLLEMATL
jgi:formylmethanofuran dehydrogenase subunit E